MLANLAETVCEIEDLKRGGNSIIRGASAGFDELRTTMLFEVEKCCPVQETLSPSFSQSVSALHGHALDPVRGQEVLLEHGPGAGRAVVAQEVASVRDGDDDVADVLTFIVGQIEFSRF